MSGELFVVENETQGLTLVRRARRADSFFTRLRGLTFRRRLGAHEALWLVGSRENRVDAAIHMFFVFFPIGVLWLDKDNRVVDTVLARPFRPLYLPKGPAISLLECQPAVLERVELGDKIRFVSHEDVDET
jgi:uncharacterized membrane protein (UPF0127 family)